MTADDSADLGPRSTSIDGLSRDCALLDARAGTAASATLSSRSSRLRFMVLVSGATFMFGNYYFFDQTSATEADVIARTNMSEDTFGMLSSVYSWPNVVLPLFGGLLVDRLGVRVAAVGFTVLVTLGSCLFSLGLWTQSTMLLVLGRVVFGFGGESQCVTCLTLIARWFTGKELAFATAIIIAVSRLGSVAAFDTQPDLVDRVGVVFASAVGSGICVLSLTAAVVAAALDKYADRKDMSLGLNVAGHSSSDEVVQLWDVLKFKMLYWCITICCVSVFVAAFPFMQVVSGPYLHDRFGFLEEHADNIVASVNLTSAILSPLLGLCVDRFGRRPLLLVCSAACLCASHVAFLVFPACYQCNSIIGVYIVMGAGLSVYGSVIWPCVPLVVDADLVGTAFGLTTAAQNLGMAISPMILTYLHSCSASFTLPFVYIIACCVIGVFAAGLAWVVDKRHGKALWLP